MCTYRGTARCTVPTLATTAVVDASVDRLNGGSALASLGPNRKDAPTAWRVRWREGGRGGRPMTVTCHAEPQPTKLQELVDEAGNVMPRRAVLDARGTATGLGHRGRRGCAGGACRDREPAVRAVLGGQGGVPEAGQPADAQGLPAVRPRPCRLQLEPRGVAPRPLGVRARGGAGARGRACRELGRPVRVHGPRPPCHTGRPAAPR